jgi:hypothetical protein
MRRWIRRGRWHSRWKRTRIKKRSRRRKRRRGGVGKTDAHVVGHERRLRDTN